MKIVFVLFLPVVLAACASLKKRGDSSFAPAPHPQDVQLFNQAFQDLGDGRYKSVVPLFKKLAEKYKGQDLERPALYNLASALKEMGQCAKAEKIYQKLIPKIKENRQLQPRLYLSLSYTYECLGEGEKSLRALKEGEPHINHLTEEVRMIEYPARLSLAYIAMDESQAGLKIQQNLYQNLVKLQKNFHISPAAEESFAKHFYTIGRSHVQPAHVRLPHFLKAFPHHQAYLVQSLLLNASPWSIRAEKELGDLYRKMWAGLKKQQNRTIYQAQVRKILIQLKKMAESAKNSKISGIYRVLNRKTLSYLKS